MKNENTMSFTQYLFRYCLCYLIIHYIYGCACFRDICIYEWNLILSNQSSYLVLMILIMLFMVGGMMVTCLHHRNYFNLILHVTLPFSIYSFLSYYSYVKEWLLPVLLIVGIICILYAGYVMLRHIDVSLDKKRVLRKRRKHCLRGIQIILTLCSSLFLIFIYERITLGGFIMRASVFPITGSSKNYDLSQHEDVLEKLESDTWFTLDMQQRLDVLQIVANVESAALGLPNTIGVVLDALDESVAGEYDDLKQSVFINQDLIMRAESHVMVFVVCHEVYHAYEYRMIDVYNSADAQYKNLMMFEDVKTYQEEFNNYKSVEDGNMEEYKDQLVEKDANHYALKALEKYYNETFVLLDD